MADFATIDDVELVLMREITEANEISAVNFHLGVVSDTIREYVEQEIDYVADEAIVLNGPLNTRSLLLPQIPVVSVSSITENDELLVAGDDYILDPGDGIVYRVGRSWTWGIQNIDVVYSHGYETIPNSLVGVCARAASRLFQAGLKAADVDGIPGVASKSLGDFSVSYAVETGEGTTGASSARVLLYSEKDILDKFKAK